MHALFKVLSMLKIKPYAAFSKATENYTGTIRKSFRTSSHIIIILGINCIPYLSGRNHLFYDFFTLLFLWFIHCSSLIDTSMNPTLIYLVIWGWLIAWLLLNMLPFYHNCLVYIFSNWQNILNSHFRICHEMKSSLTSGYKDKRCHRHSGIDF